MIQAREILQLVDKDLGFLHKSENEFLTVPGEKVYLWITKKERKVLGVVAIEPEKIAFKVTIQSDPNAVDALYGDEEHPVEFSVSRIWVDKSVRRKKIASRLLDAIR
jgi:ribosomal protein S18 acetylase RimI-like enzyme